LATLALAQKPPAHPPAGEQDEIPTFTADTNLVVLHASVFDKSGKLLTNIPQSAFHVYENGVEQPIKNFRREDVPVSMGIIIDNSGSMRDKRAKVAAASILLVKSSNPEDEVFIVNFNDDAYLDQTFTNNTKKLEEALDKIDARGGTAMRDAISMSIDYLKEKGKREKKVLLVITDGNDTQSEVLIYSIGLLSEEEPREARQAKRALKALAETTGALDYYPKDLAEIDRITPQVAHEIRSQYMISYLPTNTAFDGKFRKINVLVKASGNPTVRTRNGYYATPTAPPKPVPSNTIK
jgi:VWFA-related protein